MRTNIGLWVVSIMLFGAIMAAASEEFTSIEAIHAAGKDAVGKELVLKMKTVSVSGMNVTFGDDKGNYIKAQYTQSQRRMVRALRRYQYYIVIVKVRHVTDSGDFVYDLVRARQ